MRRLRRCALRVLLSASLFVLQAGAQGVITTVAGRTWTFSGNGGPAVDAPLGALQGTAIDSFGNVVVADPDNNIVVKVSLAGILTVVAGTGARSFSGDGGPATAATLAAPMGVAYDTAGNLYIADALNARIRKVSPNGTISTVVGGDAKFYADPEAALNFPTGVAVDAAGNLYVADAFNNRIRKVAGGIITTVAGNGEAGFSGDGGPATRAALNLGSGLHIGMALDAGGNLYIADSLNNRIRRMAPDGTITSVAAGPLASPSDVALDAGGNLYIADGYNSRIRKVSPEAGTVVTIAGGAWGFSGDGGPATLAAMRQTASIALDSAGNIYIADAGNRRLRKMNVSGFINTVAGNGLFKLAGDGGPATSASLNLPTAVVVDRAGNLLLADAGNNRIRKVAPGGTITTLPAGDLGFPSGLALDAAGNLFIAGRYGHQIQMVTPGGTATTVAGDGVAAFSGDGFPATLASLYGPQGVALDAAGNLYIADSGNHRIRKVTPGGIISKVAGNGVEGFSGDGGPATAAALNGPQAVWVGAGGTLYIADTYNGRIRAVSPGGTITTVAGGGTASPGDGGPATAARLGLPSGLLGDSAGNLYFADTADQRVRKVSPNGVITTVAGKGVGGFSGDGGLATEARLNFGWGLTAGLAIDAAGNLYLADTLNDRIRVVLATAPTLSVSTSSLSFSYLAGSEPPPAQQITLSTSLAGLFWRATVSTGSGGNWLNVSPASGQAPGMVSVSVDASSLAPGTYQGTLVLQAAGAAPPRTLTIELTVRPSRPSINPGGVVNGAGFGNQPLAAGSIAALFGPSLASSTAAAQALPLPTTLGGATVRVNAIAAPLVFVSSRQINFQVPWELAGQTQATVTVTVDGLTSPEQKISLAPFGPGIFSTNASGSGQGAILIASTGTIAAPPGSFPNSRPALRGELISIYCTGLGPVTNPPATGAAASSNPLSTTTVTPTVTIGGVPAPVVFSGLAPGFVGLGQVNARVPENAPTRDTVPVVLTIGGITSNAVTIAVQ